MAQEEKDKKVTEQNEIENQDNFQRSVNPSEETSDDSDVQEVNSNSQKEGDEERAEEVAESEEVVAEENADVQNSDAEKEEASEAETKQEDGKEEVAAGEEENRNDVVVATEADDEPVEDQEPVKEEKEPVAATPEEKSGGAGKQKEGGHHHDDHENDDEDDDYHHLDYSNYSKTQLVQAIESQLKNTAMGEVGKILKEIKPAFDEIYESEREEAYQKYLEEGGDKEGFEYKNDELDSRFLEAFNSLRDRRHSYFNDLEKQKEDNLNKKQAILERLREIVDSDETMASLKELKEIQEEWKNTGPVAPQHLKSLWANYNALIDRYYDKRSIYFELKELDRKKNLESKIELCEKAEKLEGEDIKVAIKTLNELHEEFKHIGPVPKEDQEAVWKRFKTASDAVYSRRKEYYESLREELKVNQVAKESLAEKVQQFIDFDSEKISDWNQKTKEILEVQREWEAIGGLPREIAKKINKRFWSAFKTFFNHKGQFFKKIEKARQENLKVKEELVAQAEELKDSEDLEKTAEVLKELQRKWRDIGPVPEKQRNEIYTKFKSACDHFFNRKRQNENVKEKEYVVNLKRKEELCAEIEKMVADDNIDIERIEDILEEYAEIGFVPKHDIKSIQKRYLDAISAAMEKTDLTEEDKQRVKFTAQFSKLKYGPNSHRILQKKENALRRQIAKLENDIDLWKNNLSFFAESKTADKLKKDFNEKINKATQELHSLEEQLRAITNL